MTRPATAPARATRPARTTGSHPTACSITNTTTKATAPSEPASPAGASDDKVVEYEWDHHNQLVSVINKDENGDVTQEVDYDYDAFGRRIRETLDADGDGAGAAVETEHVFDGSQRLLSLDGTSTPDTRYLAALDSIFAEEDGSSNDSLFGLADGMGGVRDLVEDDGTVANHIIYSAFGEVESETDGSVEYSVGFAGWGLDGATGLQREGGRTRDPRVNQVVNANGWVDMRFQSELRRRQLREETNRDRLRMIAIREFGQFEGRLRSGDYSYRFGSRVEVEFYLRQADRYRQLQTAEREILAQLYRNQHSTSLAATTEITSGVIYYGIFSPAAYYYRHRNDLTPDEFREALSSARGEMEDIEDRFTSMSNPCTEVYAYSCADDAIGRGGGRGLEGFLSAAAAMNTRDQYLRPVSTKHL